MSEFVITTLGVAGVLALFALALVWRRVLREKRAARDKALRAQAEQYRRLGDLLHNQRPSHEVFPLRWSGPEAYIVPRTKEATDDQ